MKKGIILTILIVIWQSTRHATLDKHKQSFTLNGWKKAINQHAIKKN